MSVDWRAGTMSTVFYLDGKRFTGYDAQTYLRDSCGFNDKEAIQYLVSLEASEDTAGNQRAEREGI